ncbi:dTDP-4-dehydrorhamnose reductase [Niveispirillum lacus]|uniref:dTDP-4-dehydrorhamnose reductase n=1 Tax=Niveispirillum lacus TaxID=1981099 RepID=A0A255Z2C2_9PROT|nr:dTDP-4-dehydrorhamnose reductase [Niveispirillum lacus]OYQ35602.1 dTDP-4-dehydrorhamnose reductase [Niveispirillum lacus]
MKVLVFGRGGQLALALRDQGSAAGHDVTCLGRESLSIADGSAVANAVRRSTPDLIVNAAAYTAVDKAESDATEAFAVNRDGTRHIAAAARDGDIPFIHVSTDYVFAGDGDRPWRENDVTGPLGVYGASKLAGEQAMAELGPARNAILRTSWVFSPYGANFVRTMLRLGADRPELRVVADQHGRPTAAHDIADAILLLAPLVANGMAQGLYHFGGAEPTTWHGFAQAVFASAARHGRPVPIVHPITTADYPTPARRPANSVLACDRYLALPGATLPDWRVGLNRAVDTLLAAG